MSPSTTAGVSGWRDRSALLPLTNGWMHSGIAVDASGTIYCAHPEGHALLRIDTDDTVRSIPTPLTELHSIVITATDNVLGVADPAHRFVPSAADSPYGDEFAPGRAVLLNSEDGSIRLELPCPQIDAYETDGWRPTSIAVDDSAGGTGEVWIADGYGASLVHRFDSEGDLLATYDGGDSGLAFDCPHGIVIRRRGATFELFVADRTNHRIVVLDSAGAVVRVFGAEQLDSPSSLVFVGDELYATELFGSVVRFFADEHFAGPLEPSRKRSHDEPGWPNTLRDSATQQRPHLTPARFNSPHGIATHNGSLFVTEWMIGGRLEQIDLDTTPHA